MSKQKRKRSFSQRAPAQRHSTPKLQRRDNDVLEVRLRKRLQAPKVGNSRFLNSLTEDAAANITWYRNHFQMLNQSEIDSSVLQAALLLEGIDDKDIIRLTASGASRSINAICAARDPNPFPDGVTAFDGTTFSLPVSTSSFATALTYLDPLDRTVKGAATRRTIITFRNAQGVAHSSAFIRHAPSLSTIVGALPQLLGRRQAIIGHQVLVDNDRAERAERHAGHRQHSAATVDQADGDDKEKKDYSKEQAGSAMEKVFLTVKTSRHVDFKQLHNVAKRLLEAEASGNNIYAQQGLQKAMAELSDIFGKGNDMSPELLAEFHKIVTTAEADGEEVLDSSDFRRIFDLATDEGGAREETNFVPGDVCWLSALPGAQLPAIPRHVLAELSAANMGHNLVQATLATNGHDVSLGDISSYPGLTQRPFLMNHLWTQRATHNPLQQRQLNNPTVDDGMLDAFRGAHGTYDVPLPSPLCPLEAVIVAVQRDSVCLEVNMPTAIAQQWFPANQAAARTHKRGGSALLTPVPTHLPHRQGGPAPHAAVPTHLPHRHGESVPPAATPTHLPHRNGNLSEVMVRAKQHVIAQTGWPVSPVDGTRWLMIRGPNTLMQERTASALDTITTGAFTGPDAVRHVICRMEGLPLLNPHAPRAALARVLGLDNNGKHVRDTGCKAVLRALEKKDAALELLVGIGATAPTQGYTGPRNNADEQWAFVRECALRPVLLAVIAEELRADEVCAFARVSTLVVPAALLESSKAQLEADAILCRRLRQLEFARQSYMTPATDHGDRDDEGDEDDEDEDEDEDAWDEDAHDEYDDEEHTATTAQTKRGYDTGRMHSTPGSSSVGAGMGLAEDEDEEDEDVEATVAPTTAGRFYFRRQYANRSGDTLPVPYEWNSSKACAYNVRVTSQLLTNGLTLASFAYGDEMRKFLDHYADAPPHSSALAFPTPHQRILHPQANHNPLPHAELMLASAILRQIPQLNVSQRKAIMAALNQSLSLIQGPPGTGKTQTITTLVWLWVCALGGTLPFADQELPDPTDYLRSVCQYTAPQGQLYTPAPFSPLEGTAVEEQVRDVLDSHTDVHEAIASLTDIGDAPMAIGHATAPHVAPPPLTATADLLTPLNVSGRGPVLISAYSNCAVDEICLRLLDLPGFKAVGGSRPLYTIIRIGRPEKIDPRLKQATIDWYLERDHGYIDECGRIERDFIMEQAKQEKVSELVRYAKRLRGMLQVKQREDERRGLTNTRKIRMQFSHTTRDLKLMEDCDHTIPSKLSLERIHEDIRRLENMEAHARRAALRRRYALRDLRRKYEERVLQSANVVIGTCMGVGSTMLDQMRFSLVVVDECSQVPETACLVPISKLAPCPPNDLTGDPAITAAIWAKVVENSTYHAKFSSIYGLHPSQRSPGSFSRVVLVGDQCQLPPVVDKERMKLAGVHISLFERLMSAAPHAVSSLCFSQVYVNNPAVGVLPHMPPLAPRTSLLHTQYRMHAALAAWISANIYGGRITSGTHPAHRKCPPGFPWPVALAHDDRVPLQRAVAAQFCLLEHVARKHAPDVPVGRFALELLQGIRASPAMERLLPSHVPHHAVQHVLQAKKQNKELHLFSECWCGVAGSPDEAHQHAISLEMEVAAHLLQHSPAQGTSLTQWNRVQVRHDPRHIAGMVQQLPVLFIDVPFYEDPRGFGPSKSNVCEAQLVAHITASLLGVLPETRQLLHKEVSYYVTYAARKAKVHVSSKPAIQSIADRVLIRTLFEGFTLDTHHLAERVGDAEERAALYRLLARTCITSAVAAAAGPRVTADQVGIVTPYVGQVREVGNALRALHDKLPNKRPGPCDITSVEVKSIDGFQGREKDVIIMTCVRSNKNGQIGFLADLRRLNVAVSRAKRGLVVIGNQETLRMNALWSSYIDSLAKVGAVVSYDNLVPWMVAGTAFPNFM